MAASRSKSKTVKSVVAIGAREVGAVPEVAMFVSLDEQIRQCETANAAFFDKYHMLLRQRDEALEQAVTVCKEGQFSCGPIVISHANLKIDWERLAELAPAVFAKCGGKQNMTPKYEGDAHLYAQLLGQQGAVSDELHRMVTSTVLVLDSATPKARK